MPLCDLKQLKTHIISLRGVLKNGGHTKGAPLDVVLVTVSDRTTLEDAYPNYFADTKLFCEIIKKIVFYELREYN
ncbi:Uncharacterised protein [Oligella urethralis]|nr:Uncharacterised protein [Oligella urethralis]